MANDILRNRVYTALKQHHLRPTDTLLVAVSGGPDSLCFLHILWRLADEADGPALHVAHLDHGFRGEQSAAEARFVADTAATWGIPATIEYHDVAAFAATHHQNRQAAARVVRYTFLARVACACGAAALAVAHQADDQAETVLLHLLRGAGPAGLRGMRAVVPWHEWAPPPATPCPVTTAPPLLRPLLDTTRAEIDHYCATHQLTPQHDPSNTAPRYTRSRIRADLLPHLANYNPHSIAALGRTASICADDYAYMQAQLAAHWSTVAEEHPDLVCFRGAPWRALHPALQRYALRKAVLHLTGSNEPGYEQIEAGREATQQRTGYRCSLGRGLLLQVVDDGFVVAHEHIPPWRAAAPQHDDAAIPQLASDALALVVPGTTPLSDTWYASISYHQPDTLPHEHPWCWGVALDADRLGAPLLLRRRRPGDRFRPAGGPGSRRLQDFFVDQKVPRHLRGAWPLLATPEHIVWVAGLRADARFQATAATCRIVWVALSRHAAAALPTEQHRAGGVNDGL